MRGLHGAVGPHSMAAMRHRTSLSLLAGLSLALIATGCGRAAPSPAPGPTTDVQVAPGDEPASPAPARESAQQPVPALPPGGFDRVPGWLGFAVLPADQHTRGWTPTHPRASAAILDADAWSEKIPEGTRFRLLSREGNLPITLTEVSAIPYGCDRNERIMAAFQTPRELAEQLVWILPDSPDSNAAAAEPVTAGPASKRKRSWTVGPLAITVQLTGKLAGRLEVREGSTLELVQSFEKPAMAGADMAPLDLTQELEIGVPYPEAAFRIQPGLLVVVLRTVTYEGVSFEVLALRDKLERAGTQYVYLCAF